MNEPKTEPAQGVPFVSLGRQHAMLGDQLREAFDRVVVADAFILGEELDLFEREFAELCEVSQCVGVASGTAALELTLEAAGIGPDDEVVIPAHTFIATALAVLHVGATPIFCDVERDTGLIDPAAAAAAVSSRTAAIIAVHLYGQACNMGEIRSLARRRGLFVLEDAAQAHGATFEGRLAGSLGDAGAFSFYPSKNLGALGDGGAVCTSDAQLAERIRELRNLGQQGKGNHVRVGRNERLDGLQAALLRVKLPHLGGWNEARRAHALRLRELLPPGLVCLGERSATPCIYHLFPVRHAERDRMVELLRAEGIQVGIHYSPAAHRHPAFDELPEAFRSIAAPEAEAWAQQELSLPMFAELTDEECERIADRCGRACELVGGPT